MILLTCTLDTY